MAGPRPEWGWYGSSDMMCMSGVRALGGEKRAVGDETAPQDVRISGRVALREVSEVFFSVYNLPAHSQSDNTGCLPVHQIKVLRSPSVALVLH